MLNLGMLLVGITDFLDWGQSAQYLTRSIPRWIAQEWSPETKFGRVAHYQHLSMFLLLGALSQVLPRSHPGCMHAGWWWSQVGSSCCCVYVMPRINIRSLGSILQKYLHFSPPAFPLFLFFKFELSLNVCVLNERKLCAASPQSDYFSNPGCQGRVRVPGKLNK